MSKAPADGGRRSRRGFAYQDAVTLLDCLDMLEGIWTEVSWEDLEDILCLNGNIPTYRQVKTIEGPGTRHSIAVVCAAEKLGKPETSYLGKLFLGKPLPDGTRFTLIVNDVPLADLYNFVTKRGHSCGPVDSRVKAEIATRLTGITLPEGRNISWCIDRFEVLIEARTIDHVEQSAISRLDPLLKEFIGQPALYKELEDVLIGLITYISRDALAPGPRKVSAAEFRTKLQKVVQQVTGRRSDGSVEPLITLQEKLRDAGVTAAEAERQHESMLAYRRKYRSSLGKERADLDDLADEIFAICTFVMARRRAGVIQHGASAYVQTLLEISELPLIKSGDVSIAKAQAILSDITARCQNRYADAS